MPVKTAQDAFVTAPTFEGQLPLRTQRFELARGDGLARVAFDVASLLFPNSLPSNFSLEASL